ncbi:MAG: serine hydrolase [Candidatus Melainabacteria bacterium]|nr:serine hydrolase [Candidatus Melainabacteria bacterium]
MTNAVLDRKKEKAFADRVIRKAVLRKRKPPGQRLLIYGAISCLVALSSGLTPLKFGQAAKQQVPPAATVPPPIALTYPLDQLRSKIEVTAAMKNLRAGVFAADLKTGKFVDYNGHDEYAAASMIKVPVYVSLLTALDRKEVSLDQPVEIRQDLITGGSGWLQWRPVGTKIPLKEVAELMIIISDNTATNMIIDLLGGKEKCNRDYVSWGLQKTRINNMLGDFEGTNKTSPYDMVYLLGRIDRGELISPDSRKWMYQTMERTRIRTLLPPGLAPGSKILHKTGDIGTMVGDAGIVTTPTGQRYIVSMQVERPHNDRRANLLIRALSKMVYHCFSIPSLTCSDAEAVPLESLAGPPVHHGRHHHHRHR